MVYTALKVRIQSFSGSNLSAFGLNTERERHGCLNTGKYEPENIRIRTLRKSPNMDTFHAVSVSVIINLFPITLYP